MIMNPLKSIAARYQGYILTNIQKSKYGKNGRKDSQKFRLSLRPFMLHWNSAIHSNNAAPESSNLMD